MGFNSVAVLFVNVKSEYGASYSGPVFLFDRWLFDTSMLSRILSTFPVDTATVEHSFFAMRRIRN